MPEANRLQRAHSFRDTAAVLRATRAGVAWMAAGTALGAYENALAYALRREQFGRPIAGFQLVQDLLVRMPGNITASAALCAQLAELQQAGQARDEHSSLAKAFCTVRMRESVGWARELMVTQACTPHDSRAAHHHTTAEEDSDAADHRPTKCNPIIQTGLERAPGLLRPCAIAGT